MNDLVKWNTLLWGEELFCLIIIRRDIFYASTSYHTIFQWALASKYLAPHSSCGQQLVPVAVDAKVYFSVTYSTNCSKQVQLTLARCLIEVIELLLYCWRALCRHAICLSSLAERLEPVKVGEIWYVCAPIILPSELWKMTDHTI